ncbi:MAG: hypothetical protein ACTSRS_01405 [Candidatus Helarchaeota archaeon]
MWELEISILYVLLGVINIGVAIGIMKFNLSRLSFYVLFLVDTILIVLLFTFYNIGEFIAAYEPFSPLDPFDVGLECLELAAFLAIFCIAFVARTRYPVIGGKGWNILLFAIILGSIGMFFDIYGEFLNFTSEFFPIYKLLTGGFQIAGVIGLALAFLMFYKFSEILFKPPPSKT